MPDEETTLAIVTNEADPAKGGAVRVAMQDIGGDEYPEWVEPVMPACLFFHPSPGDTVDVSRPAGDDITEHSEEVRYRGVLTAETQGYPEEMRTHYPKRRGIKTPAGHLVVFDDEDGTILIKSGTADASVTISPAGDVTVRGVAKVHLDAPASDLNRAPTDFLLKGTKFFADLVTTFLPALVLALQDNTFTPTDPNWIAFRTAAIALIGTLITGSATWVSTTTRTS